MATKRTHSYTVAITTVGGTTVTATDTATAKNGYTAYQQLQHHETVVIVGEESDTYVPFDAIDHAVVTKTSATAEYEDANCVVTSESE